MRELITEYDQIIKNPTDESLLCFFLKIRDLLQKGEIRVAQKQGDDWKVNSWIKTVILWGFKLGKITEIQGAIYPFFDKETMPVISFEKSNNIRLVPGGSSVRTGAYVADGTVIMPPSYINIGAYIDSGCMVDSHALVGSCAQLGKNVHLSAASQIGGVLEPVGALPVIVEDNVFIGGNCGIYEGTIIKQNAVLGSGVILTSATSVFDNTTGEFIKKNSLNTLVIPENAVVVGGSRPISSGYGKESGVHIYCPVIIKYRDSGTSRAIELEDILR